MSEHTNDVTIQKPTAWNRTDAETRRTEGVSLVPPFLFSLFCLIEKEEIEAKRSFSSSLFAFSFDPFLSYVLLFHIAFPIYNYLYISILNLIALLLPSDLFNSSNV
eukprot:TRINITY_DN6041_c0_g4_i2.p3 TRINITY_DN6041_c0_g4~~TRINITY_DN6041_c0_g4_i2.p3  ORF type:complete len:106 (+),score=8.42 TRINITY_DN6041_c0_g4_i2:675-992(+)